MVIFCLIWGPDAKNYFFPRFMTGSSQREILNNSMLKIQYKHESLIFFFLLEEKSKKISNDQELIQSDPISCPQNQKGNN